MSRKPVLAATLTFVLMGMLGAALMVQRVEASGTIVIKADGSIEPTTANITTTDNVTYTFTDNIYDEIVVERDNIVVDGAGYTLQGTGASGSYGIYLSGRSNVTIKNIEIKGFEYGINLWWYSSNNTVSGNNITANILGGIYLGFSSNNTISGNNVTNNPFIGIWIDWSSNNNTVSGNAITNNGYGIYIYESSNNSVYHDSFINNTNQAYVTAGYANIWDDGYPSGGNYWSNYTGVDLDYDGIGDTSHIIDANNTDNYPLMGPFSDFPVIHQEETYHVTTICSSTISEFQFNDVAKTISFNVTGPDYTVGFCRVTIPNIIVQDLWQGNYRVLVDGEEPIMVNNWTDGTYTYIYFKYLHSEHKVLIIPEFPAWTSMLLIVIMLTVAVVISKRRLPKTLIH